MARNDLGPAACSSFTVSANPRRPRLRSCPLGRIAARTGLRRQPSAIPAKFHAAPLAAAKAAFARAEIMRASRGFLGGQAARRSTEVRPRLGLMTRPCGLRYSLRWPSRSSFAKRFSFALEAKCSLTLPFFLIIT